MFNLTIKLNSNPLPNDCPLCGEQTNPNIGAEIFLAETETIVCIECAGKHSPVLACLVTFNDLARQFQALVNPTIADHLAFSELSKLTVRAEEMHGEKWTESQEIKTRSINSYQSFGVYVEVKNAG